ncbi:hypothetical protein [Clostridium isatidis]|uniref:Uncharacterized protein n=1 Tax=Clostridium isatidis TaxID=182773 RepID=A0A343JE18_9CLOT|nr:hypothetical protein [Clostridium isatidis]ASW43776.1 hypothetical protein BEN51_09860 [Clostridium isatidis]NLZ35454.1 hypothetical protein [Clostridiales bacterium]
MEVNDILNGLNSYDCNDRVSPIQNCNNGCGFNCWIWILLILFYSGRRRDCCCSNRRRDEGVQGIQSNSCGFLFLLVLLFICNRCTSTVDNNNFLNGSII